MKPANAPASDPGIEIGTFAAVKNGNRIEWPSGRLAFDITNAARKFNPVASAPRKALPPS